MGNNLQFWVFVVVFAFSGMSWVVRKLQEQAAIKAAKDREARRREEILRTGRDPAAGEGASEGSLDDAQARLRELAQRRQEQLRELRKREQAGGGETAAARPAVPQPAQAPQAPRPAPVTAELWPGGPVVVVGPGQAPVQAAPRPRAQTSQPRPPEKRPAAMGGSPEAVRAEREQSAKRAARAAANRRAEQVQRAAEQQEAKEAAIAKAQAARLVQGAAVRESRAAAVAAVKREGAGDAWTPPRTAEAWREAFIASEVFGPPVSGRPEHLSGRGG